MTRKVYQEVARIIRTEQDHQMAKFTPSESPVRIARQLADMFEKDNEHFDREKFLEACGVSDGV